MLTILSGPHQSGKSFQLWQRIRAQPPGAVVLVRSGGASRELVRQVHAWCGSGWMPTVMALPELIDRLATTAVLPPAAAVPWVRQALRRWCADHLAGTPWQRLAAFRSTAQELTDLVLRLDAQHVDDDDMALLLRRLRQNHNQRHNQHSPDNDDDLAERVDTVRRAWRWLKTAAGTHGVMLPGERLRALHDVPLPWQMLAVDDVLAINRGEAAWLAAVAREREVLATAIEDPRCGGGLLDLLRMAAPTAQEERCAWRPDEEPALAAVLPHLLTAADNPVKPASSDAVGCYRYRDPHHAGRAVAAWLRRAGIAPQDINLYVRRCDSEALALADALRAAEVPVSGRFRVACGSTAAGARVAALGRLLATPTWRTWCAALARLPDASSDLPTPLIELMDAPWQRIDEGLAAIQHLAEGTTVGVHEVPSPLRPELLRTCEAMQRRYQQLAPVVHGSQPWIQRLGETLAILGCDPGSAGPALQALQRIGDSAEPADLIDALEDQPVDVVRDDGPGALLVLDAVRGRSAPRPVAVLHGLEHGLWPAQPASGVLLHGEDRRRIGEPWFDEPGRISGERSALLACAHRATERLVIGIPCGHREPSPWLADIASQMGWKLDDLRKHPDAEAVAGAPLGPHDSQGDHERALWSSTARTVSLEFHVPPTPPGDLGLRLSSIHQVLGDSLSVVLGHLGIGGVLRDTTALRQGTELHEVMRALADFPDTTQWTTAASAIIDRWIAAASDGVQQAQRRRHRTTLLKIIASEAESAAGARIEAERRISVRLDLPRHGELTLHGTMDRSDQHEDGSVTVIDYKSGRAARQQRQIEDGNEGQLTAYVMSQQQNCPDTTMRTAAYVSLQDGKHHGIELELVAQRWQAICQAVDQLAAGHATARIDGDCPAAVIRASEARATASDDSGDEGLT